MTWRPALWLVAAGVVVLDQASKQWALSNLEPGERVELLGTWLTLELVRNPGAALSFGQANTWIVTAIAIAVTVGIAIYAKRAQTPLAVWLFGIGLGGAIANLLDRVFRAPSFGQGHVVDMINYNGWFVGNVADIAIVGAAIAVALLSIFGVPLLSPKEEPAESAATDASA